MDNNFYTEKIASDPNTSPDILKKILDEGNDDRISWMAVSNLNCPPESLRIVLERLFVGTRSYSPMCIYRFAAHNPNCPHDILKKIFERKKDDAISCNVAQNPNCPPELLKMFLYCGSYENASYFAVNNPNFPIEILKEVLDKGVDDYLSKMATENINCPPKFKIEWMKKVGKITRFNSNEHEI